MYAGLRDLTALFFVDMSFLLNEDCFYYYSSRNDVVVLFGTLNVQTFMLTEVRDCDLLIVVTSSTFLIKKRHVKRKKHLAQITKTRSPVYK